MTTEKIYGPSIKWDGGECPVPPNTRVKVKFRDGDSQSGHPAYAYYWHHDGDGADILTYCTIIEQSDLDAAEQLLRDNGYTVTPPAKSLKFEDVTPLTEPLPKGTDYWAVHPFGPDGVALYQWLSASSDKSILRRRMAYLDKEHALIAARHIFGLKGGEL